MADIFFYESPIGMLKLSAEDGFITGLEMCGDTENAAATLTETEGGPTENDKARNRSVLQEAVSQMDEYFAGKRRKFELKIKFSGTEFQKKVWQALREIPYGETRSYEDIAIAAGDKKAVRAVGQANKRNPIMIIAPCHRVINKNGSLGGFAGGLDAKRYLLELEREHCSHRTD